MFHICFPFDIILFFLMNLTFRLCSVLFSTEKTFQPISKFHTLKSYPFYVYDIFSIRFYIFTYFFIIQCAIHI